MRKLIGIWIAIAAMGSIALSQEYTLNQFLNVQSASSPCFSLNGNDFTYLTNTSGVNQVWRTSVTPGAVRQLTFEPDGVEGAWWSPASDELMVIAAARGGNEKTQLYMFNPAGSPWYRITHDDDAIYAFGGWAQDGIAFAFTSNERNKTDFDIYMHSIDQDAPVMLIEAEGYNRVAGFSPDGRYLLYQCHHSNVNSDLYLYEFESGTSKLLTQHEGDAVYESAQWDGTSDGFYVLSDQGRDFVGLAHYAIGGGSLEWLETPSWDIELLAVAPNGASMSWIVNENGYSRFNYKNFQTSATIGSYRFPIGVFRNLEYSRNGAKIVASFGSSSRPFDIWVYEMETDRLQQITYSATGGIAYAAFRDPVLIEYESFDGRIIPAYWYTPTEHEKKMPVIVWIHGGPESQARPDMSGLMQYFLYNGYAILEPNVRGSAGYGRAYLALDNIEKRMDSVQDIEFAAQWLKQRKDVDSEQLVVLGASYGGFMVLSNLVTYPDLWAAGVSIVGISSFETFLENTDPSRRALREAEYGSLQTDRELMASISPLTHVDKLQAPLMLIQGANDPRVPQSESDQIAEAIRVKNGTVEYLLFEDEGHGLRKIENKIEAYSAVVKFLDMHVRNQ